MQSISEYVDFLKEDLRESKHDLVALRLLAKLYIVRTSGYIFNQYRNEVF